MINYKNIILIERIFILLTIVAGTLWILFPNTLEPYVFVFTVILSGITELLRKNEIKKKKKDELFHYFDYEFNAIPTIEQLLDKALTEIEKVSNTDYNQIILDFTNKHSNHLYVVADAIPAHKQRYDIVIYEGLIGRSYKTGDTIIVNDISKVKDYFNAVPETKAEICIPLKYDTHIIGAINSESENLNHYNENLRDSLDGIATALAKNLIRLGWKLRNEYDDLVRIKRKPIKNNSCQ